MDNRGVSVTSLYFDYMDNWLSDADVVYFRGEDEFNEFSEIVSGRVEFSHSEEDAVIDYDCEAIYSLAMCLIDIFRWKELTLDEVEIAVNSFSEEFFSFILAVTRKDIHWWRLNFFNNHVIEIKSFYQKTFKSFPIDSVEGAIMSLYRFCEENPKVDMDLKSFTDVIQAKETHMKDTPIEWIIEVLV